MPPDLNAFVSMLRSTVSWLEAHDPQSPDLARLRRDLADLERAVTLAGPARRASDQTRRSWPSAVMAAMASARGELILASHRSAITQIPRPNQPVTRTAHAEAAPWRGQMTSRRDPARAIRALLNLYERNGSVAGCSFDSWHESNSLA